MVLSKSSIAFNNAMWEVEPGNLNQDCIASSVKCIEELILKRYERLVKIPSDIKADGMYFTSTLVQLTESLEELPSKLTHAPILEIGKRPEVGDLMVSDGTSKLGPLGIVTSIPMISNGYVRSIPLPLKDFNVSRFSEWGEMSSYERAYTVRSVNSRDSQILAGDEVVMPVLKLSRYHQERGMEAERANFNKRKIESTSPNFSFKFYYVGDAVLGIGKCRTPQSKRPLHDLSTRWILCEPAGLIKSNFQKSVYHLDSVTEDICNASGLSNSILSVLEAYTLMNKKKFIRDEGGCLDSLFRFAGKYKLVKGADSLA